MRSNSSSTARLRLVAVLLITTGLLFTSRLFQLQIIESERYRGLADRQYAPTSSRLFNRGTIYFQDKSGRLFIAAGLKQGLKLALKPDAITDPEKTFAALQPIISDLERDAFLRQAARRGDPYEEVATRLTFEQGAAIEKLNLPGLMLYPDRWRDYPLQSVGAHLIGLLSYQGDDLIGSYGLERQYDSVLARRDELSFKNFFTEILSGLSRSAPAAGTASGPGDIVLTIEPRVEKFITEELENLAEHYQPESGGAIVIEPKTGAIRALAAIPTFNPAERQKDIGLLLNPLVEKVYEMGSIVKPLTIAAGLDAGVITPESGFVDTGSVTLDGHTIKNHDEKIFGRVDIQKILNQSINTGAVFVMQKLGRDRFRQYFFDYGLGEKTKIDLPGEAANIVGNLKSSRQIEYATAAFGQGVAFSPISIVRALAVLGNGGYLVTPHVLDHLEYDNRLTTAYQNPAPKVILKPETTRQISNLLVAAVDQALAGGRASLPHYSIAAKTGTAQIARPEKKDYYSDRYLHSFFGYFPAYDAKFLVFYYLVYPKGVAYSSDSLTDPFIRTTKFLIDYYEIPPDR